MSTKEPTASKIVQNPRLWPSSFSRPVFSQKVCINTYIFKNGSDIQKFIQFVEGSFPNYVIDIKQNEDGSTSVSLTNQSGSNVSNNTTTVPATTTPCISSKAVCYNPLTATSGACTYACCHTKYRPYGCNVEGEKSTCKYFCKKYCCQFR